MRKIIRIVIIALLVVLIILGGFQWKNYHEKSQIRENALLYFKEKDYEKAVSYLEKGLKQISVFGDDMDEDMSCYLAESYYQLGDYEKSLKIYDELLDKHPEEQKYIMLKAENLIAMDKMEDAISLYEEGWDKTKNSIFLREICDCYLEKKKYKKALKYAKQGVDLEGEESREFLFKEIVIYEKCNDYQSAYDTALEYTKRYPEDEKGQKELKFLETRI
jgi:tetratricopeptide (TPR) repeat protein